MNNQSYGINKQLFRTSYSPSVQNVRPSSLNSPIFTQSHISSSPMIRIQSPNSSSIIRQPPRNGILGSQVSMVELNKKQSNNDYYPEIKSDDILKGLQQKIDQIGRKVGRNTEEIKMLRQLSKNQENKVNQLSAEMIKLNKRNENLFQECSDKISLIRSSIEEIDEKMKKTDSERSEKIEMKFDEKQLFKVKSMVEERVKQETNKIKKIIENEISKVSHELKWEMQRQKTETSPFRSKLKYPFKSIKLVYHQYLQTNSKSKSNSRMSTRESLESPRAEKVLMRNEQIYYIDREGFLLDEDSYYILDSEEKMIRLSSGMLQQLRQSGLLSDK